MDSLGAECDLCVCFQSCDLVEGKWSAPSRDAGLNDAESMVVNECKQPSRKLPVSMERSWGIAFPLSSPKTHHCKSILYSVWITLGKTFFLQHSRQEYMLWVAVRRPDTAPKRWRMAWLMLEEVKKARSIVYQQFVVDRRCTLGLQGRNNHTLRAPYVLRAYMMQAIAHANDGNDENECNCTHTTKMTDWWGAKWISHHRQEFLQHCNYQKENRLFVFCIGMVVKKNSLWPRQTGFNTIVDVS